jgi:hypothetical protein
MNTSLAEVIPCEGEAVQELNVGLALQAVPDFLGQQEATPPQGNVSVVPDPIEHNVVEANPMFINADHVPELAARRQAARETATRIMAQNSNLLHNGRTEQVPSAVDALGTARQVNAAKEKFGIDSPEHQEMFDGLVLDDERLIGEAATNEPEHFRRVRQEFNRDTRAHYAHGLSISTMTKNGLSPLCEPEEQDRRVEEYVVENGTLAPMGEIIAEVGLRGMVELLPVAVDPELPKVSVQVTTIEECADYAQKEYEINPKGSHSGYKAAMKGIAIGRAHFEDDSGDRESEHAIISGVYITHDIIQEVLAEEGVLEPDREYTKTQIIGTQLISVNGGGLMEFIQKLDEKAGARHGKNLLMGAEVADDDPKDYAKVMGEAGERRERLAPLAPELAKFQINLEEKGVDDRIAGAMVSKFLKTKLLAIAKNNPDLAESMFDKATAEGFAEVARLEAAGRHAEAGWLQADVERNAPEVSYCGAGCAEVGEVDALSPTGQLAASLGLRGEMVHNKVAACENCHEKQLVHDYQGNTVCVGCKSTKLNGHGVRHHTEEETVSKEKPALKPNKETTKKSGGETTLVLVPRQSKQSLAA